MSTSQRFREYAAECVSKAADAATAEDKTLLLNMALAWLRLAQQVEDIAGMSDEAGGLGLTACDDESALVAESGPA